MSESLARGSIGARAPFHSFIHSFIHSNSLSYSMTHSFIHSFNNYELGCVLGLEAGGWDVYLCPLGVLASNEAQEMG
jgi:hypothetical protein